MAFTFNLHLLASGGSVRYHCSGREMNGLNMKEKSNRPAEIRVYLDMDGVLADFNRGFCQFS